MVVHVCDKCNKEFYNRTHLINHKKRLRPCYDVQSSKINNPQKRVLENEFDKDKIINSELLNEYLNNNQCVYCESKFAHKNSVVKHMKGRCKEMRKIEEEKKEIFDQLKALKDENKELKYIIKGISEKFDNVISNNKSIINNNKEIQNNYNNNGNENIIQQNINLVPYGTENIDLIDKRLIINSLNKVYSAPLYLTDAIHYNEKFPEFHNIYIPSVKDKYAMKYYEGRWNLVDKNDLIEQIYEDKKILVEENLSKFIDNLSDNKRKRLIDWIENDAEGSGEGTLKVKEEIKMLLYNKRDMPLKIQKNNEVNKKLKLKKTK